jgi:putative nucleotidyltransferase with HDIG domain
MPGDEGKKPVPTMEERVIATLARINQDLPTIPVVVSRLMHLSSSDETSINDIIQVLNQDQVLTTKILRVSNSAFYGLREKATTIDRAVVILGFDMIRALAISVSFIQHFSPKNRCEGFELGLFWTHTIAVGAFSEILARQWGSIDPGDAFTAGIMHDIGKLVMLIYFEDEFKRVLQRAADEKIDFYEAEMLEIGISHAFVAAMLLRFWNIPEILVGTIENHHRLLVSKDDLPFAACIHLADFTAKHLNIGASGSQYYNPPSLELLKQVGYSAASFNAWLKEMYYRRDEVFELISALD